MKPFIHEAFSGHEVLIAGNPQRFKLFDLIQKLSCETLRGHIADFLQINLVWDDKR